MSLKKVVPSVDNGVSTHTSHVNQALKELVESTRGNPKYLYQSATPCFHYDVLLEQFLVQLFNPVSRIYLVRRYGWQAVRNQFNGSLQAIIHLYWIVPLFYLVFRNELRGHGITDSEVAICFFAGTMLRLTIATKYATMSPEEYLTFMMCEDINRAKEYQQHTQLVTGWLSVDIPFCWHESNLALARMGFHLGSTLPPCFEVKCSEVKHWKSLLGETTSVLHTKKCGLFGAESVVEVDVADLMAMIIAACDCKHYLPYLIPPTMVIILIWSMLPCLVRVSCDSLAELVTYDDVGGLCKSSSFFGDGPLANVFSVLLLINSFMNSFPLYMFFVSTVLGSIRHQTCSKTYGQLARVDAYSPTVDKCPIIDMTVHTNIRAWVRSMLALHFFGNRYYNRVDIYAKLCALILIGLLIWLYIFSLQVDQDATGANELILDIRYWSVCYLLVVWGGAFALILGIMSDTNFALKQHEVMFLLHRLSVRENRMHNNRRMSSHIAQGGRGLARRASGVLDSSYVGALLKTMSMIDDGPSPPASPREEQPVEHKELNTKANKEGDRIPKTMSIGELEELVYGHTQTSKPTEAVIGTDDQNSHDASTKEDSSVQQGGEDTKVNDDSASIPTDTAGTSISVSQLEEIRQSHEKELPPKQDVPKREAPMDEPANMQERWMATSKMMENEQLDDLMDTAVMILESQMRVNPRRFLGASASWNLVKSYMFAWASLIAFALTVAGINYSS